MQQPVVTTNKDIKATHSYDLRSRDGNSKQNSGTLLSVGCGAVRRWDPTSSWCLHACTLACSGDEHRFPRSRCRCLSDCAVCLRLSSACATGHSALHTLTLIQLCDEHLRSGATERRRDGAALPSAVSPRAADVPSPLPSVSLRAAERDQTPPRESTLCRMASRAVELLAILERCAFVICVACKRTLLTRFSSLLISAHS